MSRLRTWLRRFVSAAEVLVGLATSDWHGMTARVSQNNRAVPALGLSWPLTDPGAPRTYQRLKMSGTLWTWIRAFGLRDLIAFRAATNSLRYCSTGVIWETLPLQRSFPPSWIMIRSVFRLTWLAIARASVMSFPLAATFWFLPLIAGLIARMRW